MILILAQHDDYHVEIVTRRLKQLGADFVWFDGAQFPVGAELSITYSATGRRQRVLRVGSEVYDLSRITVVWERSPNAIVLHEQVADDITRNYLHGECEDFLADVWHTLDCP